MRHRKTPRLDPFGFEDNFDFGYSFGGKGNLESGLAFGIEGKEFPQRFSESIQEVERTLGGEPCARQRRLILRKSENRDNERYYENGYEFVGHPVEFNVCNSDL